MKSFPKKSHQSLASSATPIPNTYELCISGLLGPQTASWFEDMALTFDENTTPPQTILRGSITDQAALYGLINRARDLGLTLLSVNPIKAPQTPLNHLQENNDEH